MFDATSPLKNYPLMEEAILKFWQDNAIFAKLAVQNSTGKAWNLIDGPVTANNKLGVHHAWGRTYKDIFQRYHSMLGEKLHWQNGYDCHGLWVEVEVEKTTPWNDVWKHKIKENMSSFSKDCQSRVNSFAEIITKQSIRLGQWNNWHNSYRTDSTSNIEHIWHFLGVCQEKGLLQQGTRVMPWCTRCGTSLSQHEMADCYQDKKTSSIKFICFLEDTQEFMLVWTTTPWTIPANAALAVHPEVTYCLIATASGKMWMSKDTKEQFYTGVTPLCE